MVNRQLTQQLIGAVTALIRNRISEILNKFHQGKMKNGVRPGNPNPQRLVFIKKSNARRGQSSQTQAKRHISTKTHKLFRNLIVVKKMRQKITFNFLQ